MSQEFKGLRPGIWCKPSEERVRNAILDLAESLGIASSYRRMPYDLTPNLWWIETHRLDCVSDVTVNAPNAQAEVHVSEFIARMYEQAEINKKAKVEVATKTISRDQMIEANEVFMKELSRPTNRHMLDDHEKRIKALEERMKRQEDFATLNVDLVIEQYDKRLKVVEERVSKLERPKPQYAYPSSPRSSATHWPLIGYRKEESPKNLPFEIALVYAKAGRKIKRAPWLGWIHVKAWLLRNQNGDAWDVASQEAMTQDWEVVPE